MRLVHLLPAALLIAVAEATMSAYPAIVAEREGGMGLGSALIAAHIAQLGALAPGALGAAWTVDRGWQRAPLVAGALLFAIGSFGVATQPMHALDWVVVSSALAGAGLGAVLVAAFSAAARLPTLRRSFGIGLLLLAPFVGRALIVPVAGAASLGLAAAAVGAVGLAVLAVLAWRGTFVEGDADSVRRLPGAAAFAGSVVLALGMVALSAGIESSGVSAIMLAGPLGLTELEQLEAVRAAMTAIGILGFVVGAVIVLVATRPPAWVAAASAALAVVIGAASGVIGQLGWAGGRPDGGAVAAFAAVGGLGAVIGILAGAWAVSRGDVARLVAVVGCGLVALGTALALLAGQLPPLADSPIALAAIIGVTAVGGGLAAVALRTLLAAVRVGVIGFAASAGVLANAWGSSVGSMVGVGEAYAERAGGGAMPVGGAVLFVAAVIALVASLRARREAAAAD